jgi:hypothetical protein
LSNVFAGKVEDDLVGGDASTAAPGEMIIGEWEGRVTKLELDAEISRAAVRAFQKMLTPGVRQVHLGFQRSVGPTGGRLECLQTDEFIGSGLEVVGVTLDASMSAAQMRAKISEAAQRLPILPIR